MKLKVSTSIVKEELGFESSSSKYINQVFGSDFDNNFVVKGLNVLEYEITESEKDSFEFDINTIIQDFTKVSMIQVYCKTRPESPSDIVSDTKFSIFADGVQILKASQFTLINTEEISFTSLRFSNFSVEELKTSILTIAIANK